jgi:hypothetical protein
VGTILAKVVQIYIAISATGAFRRVDRLDIEKGSIGPERTRPMLSIWGPPLRR